MTSRERVHRTLEFNTPDRVPRHLWDLPIAWLQHGETVKREFKERWPEDICQAPNLGIPPSPVAKGDPHQIGTHVDEWGCVFENIKTGVHGEVKEPILEDWDFSRMRIPREKLELDVDAVNAWCRGEQRFVQGGGWARPFERAQFLRGTENVYMDLAEESPEFEDLLKQIHEFCVDCYQLWASTEVDGLVIMDDWGSQTGLLINPDMWRTWFKPLYAEYSRIAHDAGKKLFMHSDGNISSIYEDLIEIGIDAINSQIFCMDIDELAEKYRGRITFWGEIDRQHVLPHGTVADVEQAVQTVIDKLYDPAGGVIAQFSWEEDIRLENANAVFASWEKA